MDWLMPDESAALGPDALRRARLTVTAAGLVTLGFGGMAVMEWSFGTAWIGLVYAAAALLVVGIPWLQRATGSPALAGHALMAMVTGLVGVLLFATGGTRTAALYGTCIIPLAGGLIGGLRVGITWTVVAGVMLGAVAVGVAQGVAFPAPVENDGLATSLRGSIILLLATLAAAIAYDRTQSRTLRETAAALAKAEEERRKRSETEQRLALALDATAEGVWDWDVRTGELLLSPPWFAALGYDPAEFPRRIEAWQELVHPEDRNHVQQALLHHVAGRTPVAEAEYRLRTASGEWLHCLIRGKVVERAEDGSPLRMVGVDIDISERKRAREVLEQAKKLESLGVLAGGIAHDFNNLLVGIQGNAELARLALPSDSPARDSVLDIEHAGQQAAELSNQLLMYAGGGQRRIERVGLGALVEDATRLLAARFPRVSAHCEVAGVGPWIDADPVQIHQVVVNLLVNAAEALDDNSGSVRIGVGVMHADAETLASCFAPLDREEGEYAYVEVSDDGCGMGEETVARVFDPFFTTKFAGRGLGLASALGVVRSHGGTLRVESTPGQGTTFRLLFPERSPAEAADPTPSPSRSESQGTILVVDDDESVLRVAQRMLERAGYETIAAASGADAVARVSEHGDAISVVLLDVTMPDLGGEETFDLLREQRADLPVLFFSGHSKEAGAQLAASRPLAGFVQKPFTLAELGVALEDLQGSAEKARRDTDPPRG